MSILFLFAIAMSTSVAYSVNMHSCKKDSYVKYEQVSKKIVKAINDIAILPVGVGISDANHYTDTYVVIKPINKSLQKEAAYIWYKPDKRC